MTNKDAYKKNLILALETSCDETSASVIRDGREILSNVISSQIEFYQKYGGVVPEIASRKHLENIICVIDAAVKEAGITIKDLDAIGVTYGPGLVGALLVGVSAAKALSFALDIPLIKVNHLEGHIFANFLEHKDLEPPFIALIVSGGHTILVHVRDYNDFEVLGQTRDDAAGEAFDKVARVLGFPYPGGPYIEKTAQEGNENAIEFPKAFINSKSDEFFEFSFSGLKSAVLNYINNTKQKGEEINIEDLAASFQKAIVDVLVLKTTAAAKKHKVKNVVLAGGVAANKYLRLKLEKELSKINVGLYYPSNILCTDNAAMIGSRAFYKYKEDVFEDCTLNLNAIPSLNLDKR